MKELLAYIFRTKSARRQLVYPLLWGLYLFGLAMIVSWGNLLAAFIAGSIAAAIAWVVLYGGPKIVRWVENGED